MKKGQITINALMGIIGLIGGIATPLTLYFSKVGGIETTVAVHETRVTSLEEEKREIRMILKEQNANIAIIKETVAAMAAKQGIKLPETKTLQTITPE